MEATPWSFDLEKNYGEVLGKRLPGEIYNFCTFGLAGEGMKKRYAVADNTPFIENHLQTQIPRFDPFGMYRDPNCPMTYYAAPRMNLSLLFHPGYRGAYFSFFDEMLRRGALTMLLCLSPTGEAPFGGRSNQQNFNEATIALICEFEASRYQKRGNHELAGVFKRAAQLAARSAPTLARIREAGPLHQKRISSRIAARPAERLRFLRRLFAADRQPVRVRRLAGRPGHRRTAGAL